MVRIPSLGSGKNFSFWLRKNSPHEVLMISLARFNPMETTQKKQSAQGICFYLRRKIQIAPRTCTGKLTHGPQSPTWYFTPQRFSSWGQGQPCLPELPLVRGHSCDGFFATHAKDVTVSTEAFLGQIHSLTGILHFQWTFCLLPSFLFDDLC